MSDTPNSASAAFNESLAFVKKLWGGMHVPGMNPSPNAAAGIPNLGAMAMPSMSLEDLDKRIQDLKTVETWLNLNMNMLRNTIQTMEVQRGTIATLHSLSSTMAQSMKSMSDAGAKVSAGMANPFASATTNTPPEAATANHTPDEPATSEAQPNSANGEQITPLMAQSAAWWTGVQEQFKQALGTALEKSAANAEAAKTAGEMLVKASVPIVNQTINAAAMPSSKVASTSATASKTSATKTTAKAAAKPTSPSKPRAKAVKKATP